MKKIGIIITVLGGIGLVAAILIGVLMGAGGIKQLADTPKVEINSGEGTAELLAETEYRVFERSGEPGLAECTISSPSGEQINLEGVVGSVNLGEEEGAWTSTRKITSADEGSYSFSCDRAVMLAKKEDIDKIFPGLIGIFGGVFGGIAALIVFALGMILFFIGRHHEKQRAQSGAQRNWQPPYGGAPGQGYPAGAGGFGDHGGAGGFAPPQR